eukprot:12611419-Prorocentrum_lima.AAC.1
MWSDSFQRLDFEAQPQGYRLWKHRARTFLLGRFPQVGSILEWAEKQVEPIPVHGHQSVVRLASDFEYSQLSGVLYGAIQRTISDQL